MKYTTGEIKALKANPYTLEATKNRLCFTVKFKEAFWAAYQAGVAPRRIFEDLGYDPEMFGQRQMHDIVQSIKKQALSGDGFRQGWGGRKKMGERKTRCSWEELGISPERRKELQKAVRSGQYDELARSAALEADRVAAGHILLSVAEKISFDWLEFHAKLGRCPLGRTDFYAKRRLFFHYLDNALKDRESGADRMPHTENQT